MESLYNLIILGDAWVQIFPSRFEVFKFVSEKYIVFMIQEQPGIYMVR